MSVDPQVFASKIIGPVLQQLGLDQYRAQAATELLLGTALQESELIYRRQVGGGPALGLFQMEPNTHDDIWANFLQYHPVLAKVLEQLADSPLVEGGSVPRPSATLVENNDAYAAGMCRVHYLRAGQIVGQTPLPEAGDIEAMGAYWKRFYNTSYGAGDAAEFVVRWRSVHPEV